MTFGGFMSYNAFLVCFIFVRFLFLFFFYPTDYLVTYCGGSQLWAYFHLIKGKRVGTYICFFKVMSTGMANINTSYFSY